MRRVSFHMIVLGRILVAIVFLLNATGIVDQTEAARELAARGAPSDLIPFMMIVARGVELLAALGLVFGISPRVAALALFGFLLPATLVGHAFWLATSTSVFMVQLINFGKNLAIMGGLLFIASVDSQPALRWAVKNGANCDAAFNDTRKAHL